MVENKNKTLENKFIHTVKITENLHIQTLKSILNCKNATSSWRNLHIILPISSIFFLLFAHFYRELNFVSFFMIFPKMDLYHIFYGRDFGFILISLKLINQNFKLPYFV
jgi:hypothetical protein